MADEEAIALLAVSLAPLSAQKGLPLQLAVRRGAFLPYAHEFYADWTGYYSNRPLLKRAIRETESLLRATDMAVTAAALQLAALKGAQPLYEERRVRALGRCRRAD